MDTIENKCHLHEKDETPVEDLTGEHGLLNRILLIYEEIADRIDGISITNKIYAKHTSPLTISEISGIAHTSAQIIRNFIEDYHEKNEEKYIFPVVQRCPQFRHLIKTLIKQHQIGREYTTNILDLSLELINVHEKYNDTLNKNKNITIDNALSQLSFWLRKFVRMYRAHESREDTIVFRAFHELASDAEYLSTGKIMESIEEEKFGEDDYIHILDKIMKMEINLNIHDLSVYS